MVLNPLSMTKLVLLTATILTILEPSRSEEATIYTLLSSHGLPAGVFPAGISNFSLDSETSRFEFHLPVPSSCDAQFETSLRYDSTVSGTISYGAIRDLEGVAAQELFIWLPVNGLRVDAPPSGLIYFDVGVISKQFSISYFEAPRDCVVSGEDKLHLVDLSFVANRNPILQNLHGEDMTENLLSE